MHSFHTDSPTNSHIAYSHSHSSYYLRNSCDLGDLQPPAGNGFHQLDQHDIYNLTKISSVYNGANKLISNSSVLSNSLALGGVLTNSLCSAEIVGSSSTGALDQIILQRPQLLGFGGSATAAATLGNDQFGNWEDSGVAVADHSHHTDTNSTDTDEKNQFTEVDEDLTVLDNSNDQSNGIIRDPKSLVKLAQNREAARRSRLKKKAYVQQLESSRQRLIQVEQNLKRVKPQGVFVRSRFSGDHEIGIGCVQFDVEHARWLEEHQRHINDLRSALNSRLSDAELHLVVEVVVSHHHELYRIKRSAAKSDAFHVLSGNWKTPAERFFMWLGGFRSSDLLKVLGNHIEPLSEQQLVGIFNLQQSCLQSEDALSQGMEALQQSIVETLSHNSLAPRNAGNVVDYMGQMAIAITNIATIENFLHQADLLRLQTLQQLQRILTARQAARALLAINEYKSRLRALSSLWLARPRE